MHVRERERERKKYLPNSVQMCIPRHVYIEKLVWVFVDVYERVMGLVVYSLWECGE